MGIISKQYYKRETAGLLRPACGIVKLSGQQAFGIAKQLVDTFEPDRGFVEFVLNTGYRYWFRVQDDETCVIVCGHPQPQDATQCRVRLWEARLQVSRRSDLAGQVVVELRLTHYRQSKDKELVRKDAYVAFRDQLFAELQAADPTFAHVPA